MKYWRRSPKPPNWYPRRGEVCLIALDKERPAVIISSNSLNAHSLDVCVLPVSTVEHRSFSLRPRLEAGEAGLIHRSWVKCDQPTTVEKRLVVFPPLGLLSLASMGRIEAAVKAALDFS